MSDFQNLISGNFRPKQAIVTDPSSRHVSSDPDACHNLAFVDGRASLYLAAEKAWHGFGTVCREAQGSGEAIHMAGLDWKAEEQALQTALGAGIDTHKALVRSDTGLPLSVVGKGYTAFQNSEMFDLLDSIVGQHNAKYETAGALDDGRRVWALLRVPGEIRASANDTILPYILCANAHDGTAALRIMPTSVRVVCNNTYRVALGHRTGFSIRHTKGLPNRVMQAAQVMQFATGAFESFSISVARLAAVKCEEPEARTLFAALLANKVDTKGEDTGEGFIADQKEAADFGRKLAQSVGEANRQLLGDNLYRELANKDRESVRSMTSNYRADVNNMDGNKSTAWSAFNAITDWADHDRTVRAADNTARNVNRFQSNLLGTSDDLKQLAFTAIDAFASASAR